jgi:PAS domain-containing protein
MRRPIQAIIGDYLFACGAVIVAAVCAVIMGHLNVRFKTHGFFGFFLIAVALSAWRAGFTAALLAIILSVAAASWLFIPPEGSFRMENADDIARVAVFVTVAIIISSLHMARERTEKKLQQSEQRLGFALDSSGVGCWDADVKVGAFWRSANLPELYGRSDHDFATTYEGFFAYIHPEDRDFFRLASVQGGLVSRTYEISHRVIGADGTFRRLHTRGKMYLDREGKIDRMVGAVYALDQQPLKPGVLLPFQGREPSLDGLTGATEGNKARPPAQSPSEITSNPHA